MHSGVLKQVIVVMFADWTVLSFDENLNLLWKKQADNTSIIARYCVHT